MFQLQSVELTGLPRDLSYSIGDFDHPPWQSTRREVELHLIGVTYRYLTLSLWLQNHSGRCRAAVSDAKVSHWSGGNDGIAPT